MVALAGITSSALAASPYGVWERPSTGTKVKFYECAGKLCAKIVGVKDPAKKKTVGTVIMGGAKKVAENKWEGDLLNTENGNVYSGYVTLSGAGLKLQGCALGGLVCSGETWKPAN
ncbi:MAG: DUF2147 domain-containing protein [Hyphomicrobiaceae bacterium]|nr:DUF2147 domain-containing protein [Hyphomicrobiaceae bacterium]